MQGNAARAWGEGIVYLPVLQEAPQKTALAHWELRDTLEAIGIANDTMCLAGSSHSRSKLYTSQLVGWWCDVEVLVLQGLMGRAL